MCFFESNVMDEQRLLRKEKSTNLFIHHFCVSGLWHCDLTAIVVAVAIYGISTDQYILVDLSIYLSSWWIVHNVLLPNYISIRKFTKQIYFDIFDSHIESLTHVNQRKIQEKLKLIVYTLRSAHFTQWHYLTRMSRVPYVLSMVCNF